MFKHILVPTDGSQLSNDTASRAISFAREAGAIVRHEQLKTDSEGSKDSAGSSESSAIAIDAALHFLALPRGVMRAAPKFHENS